MRAERRGVGGGGARWWQERTGAEGRSWVKWGRGGRHGAGGMQPACWLLARAGAGAAAAARRGAARWLARGLQGAVRRGGSAGGTYRTCLRRCCMPSQPRAGGASRCAWWRSQRAGPSLACLALHRCTVRAGPARVLRWAAVRGALAALRSPINTRLPGGHRLGRSQLLPLSVSINTSQSPGHGTASAHGSGHRGCERGECARAPLLRAQAALVRASASASASAAAGHACAARRSAAQRAAPRMLAGELAS